MDQQLKQKPTPVGGGRDDGAKRKIVCWHCGEDHPKRLCPNLDKPPVNPRAGGSNNNNNSDGNKDGSKGKWAKPKDGEPHEKMINGSKWFYCTKCRGGKGGWTKNHTTATHKSKEQLEAEKKSSGPSAALASSAYCQEIHSSWFE